MDPADILGDLTQVYGVVAPALLVFARVVGLFVSAPVIGGEHVPLTIKTLVAIALTGVITPLHWQELPPGIVDTLPYAVALLRELGVGLFLGFIIDLFFQAIQFGGDLMGRTAGYAAAEVFDPSSGGMRGPVGEFLSLAAILLLFFGDGHHIFIMSLDRSFEMIPIGSWVPDGRLHAAVTAAASQLFVIAVTLAFPVLAVILAVGMAEGVIARTIPQINILHITFAIKICIFMVVLYAGLPAAVAFMGLVIAGAQECVFAMLPLMA
jgi:flagellar biosynthetic protein FliR